MIEKRHRCAKAVKATALVRIRYRIRVRFRRQLTPRSSQCSPLHNRDLHNIADLKHVYESAFNRVGTERLRNMIRALAAPPGRPLSQGLRVKLHPVEEASGACVTSTPRTICVGGY